MEYAGMYWQKLKGTKSFIHMTRLSAGMIYKGEVYLGKEHYDIIVDQLGMDVDDVNLTELEQIHKMYSFELRQNSNGDKYIVLYDKEALIEYKRELKELSEEKNAKLAMYDFKSSPSFTSIEYVEAD